MRTQAALVVLLVLLLRLPFLGVAMQWDDFNYLKAAEYAQQDPAHPHHASYVFQGVLHDMRGHPHPPGNSWILAALWAVFGGVNEVGFHAFYMAFSISYALAMLALARRWAPRHAVGATLLFLLVPAMNVSGTSLESDTPFLAFWMLSVALFLEAVDRRRGKWLIAACAAMAAAQLTAYQAILLIPILGAYLLLRRTRWKAAWCALLTPALVFAAFQLFEFWTSRSLPAAVLTGHFQTYGLQRLEMKLKNAVALTAALAWMASPLLWLALLRRVPLYLLALPLLAMGGGYFLDPNPLFWVSLGLGVFAVVWILTRLRQSEDRFLAVWALLFFAGALVIFFAGAARYLLPMAAPLALLLAGHLGDRRRLWFASIATAAVLALSLTAANAQHWNACRQIASEILERAKGRRVWTAAEWGFRYYMERGGAKPLLIEQQVRAGDWVAESALSMPVHYSHAGSTMDLLRQDSVIPLVPFRVAGIETDTAFETVAFGLAPFAVSLNAADVISLWEAVPNLPTLSFLLMNDPQVEKQIASGVYGLEAGEWRWAGREASFLLKKGGEAFVAADLFIPDTSPVQKVDLLIDGKVVASQEVKHGAVVLRGPAPGTSADSVLLTIRADRDFRTPGDGRSLSLIVKSAGYTR